MEAITAEQVRIILGRSGLQLPDERIEVLTRIFEKYRPRLELLHAVDVENEEIAGTFHSTGLLE